MSLLKSLFLFSLWTVAICSPSRRSSKFSSESVLFQDAPSSENGAALYSFTYEGITPQNVVTGCQGVKYSDGTTSTDFYVIDGTGIKKTVKPGSSISVVFPAPFMLPPTAPGLSAIVHHKDMCFPRQCGASHCGFTIGPVGNYGVSSVMQTSSLSRPPGLAFSQIYGGFPKNNATSTTNSTQDKVMSSQSIADGESSGTMEITEESQNSVSIDSSSDEKIKSSLYSPFYPSKADTPCSPAAAPPSCPPPVIPAGCPVPSYIVQPPAPQCNCVCNCDAKKENDVPSREMSELMSSYPSAFVSAGSSRPAGSTKQRNDAAYYASLPGAIRGHTGVIYYPSCERDAYHQVAIVPFCDYRRNGRGFSFNVDVAPKNGMKGSVSSNESDFDTESSSSGKEKVKDKD